MAAGNIASPTCVPGIYTVTFTLTGFSTLRREGIEVNAEVTVPLNAELKVGAVEETVTVVGATPVVDVQNVAARTVMTREVMDAIPQGRNIQAIGIMIPGTTLQVGGGGAISRDVGGSGSLQQSPLAYRGSVASVQTVEGMRMNNLCGVGPVQRQLLERRHVLRDSATPPAPTPPKWDRAACAST